MDVINTSHGIAGTMMGAVCNGLTIIFLGMIGTGSDRTGRYDVNYSQGGMLRGRNKARTQQSAHRRKVVLVFAAQRDECSLFTASIGKVG